MKNITPTLLALVAIAPTVAALDVKDDDIKLGLFVRLQARADWSKSTNADGDQYDIATGSNSQNDPVDFYMRRARIGFQGSYKNDYKFVATVAADKLDSKDTSTGRAIVAYEMFVGRIWKDEDNKLTHEVDAGLMNPFFNDASSVCSSANFLFPSTRATDTLLNNRGTGLGYKLSAPMGTFGVNILNNKADDNNTNGDGLFYSGRVEFSPEGEFHIAKTTESFVGKAGKGILVAVDVGQNTRDNGDITTLGWGAEILGHADGLTAIAEFRRDKIKNNVLPEPVAGATQTKQIMLVQAGYALPALANGSVVEPAIRFTKLDLNKEVDTEGTSYGGGLDYGTSGTQIELGVNYYINGHNNKLQLEYLNWKGEENAAGDKAKASIVRAQWQLTF